MPQPVIFKSPLKGVVRASSFQDQPNDAAIDALNVLPFDTAGRLRVRQRSGTVSQYADPLGAGSPVKLLTQTTTLANSGDSGVGFTDEFNYSDGDLNTVASAVWKVTGNSWEDPGPDPNSLLVSGDTVRSGTSGQQGGSALYVGDSVPLTDPVTVTMDFVIPSVTYDGTQQWSAVLGARISPGGGSDGQEVEFFIFATANSDGTIHTEYLLASFFTSDGDVLPDGSLSYDTTFTLKLVLNGASIDAYLNDVLISSASDSTNEDTTGFGFALQNASSDATQYIQGDNFTINSGSVPTSSGRLTNLIAVSDGSIYIGDLDTTAIATDGNEVLDSAVIPSVAFADGKAYFVDGTVIKVLDVASQTVSDFTATAGDAPSGCTLAATYRDRLVLAAPLDTPQNFFLSRVGTQTDFDFSQEDPAAAFAGNASEFGRIGEPITALMPFNDDLMYIGGDHDLWAMRGDPADGGSIDLVSDAIGVLSNTAWTKTPEGTVLFVGTGGLYKLDPQGGAPVNISTGQWEEFFRSINRTANYITMEWDRDRQGAYIFIVPVDGTTQGTGIFYDLRSGGFWPIQFPVAAGPFSATLYDGDGPEDRFIFLGGVDGSVRRLSEDDASDDGAGISSYVYLGPFASSDIEELVIDSAEVILGEPPGTLTDSDWNVRVDLLAGQTVERAFNSPRYTRSRTFTSPRRQTRWLTRIRGAVFFIKLSNSVNDKTWVFERIIALMNDGGVVRRR